MPPAGEKYLQKVHEQASIFQSKFSSPSFGFVKNWKKSFQRKIIFQTSPTEFSRRRAATSRPPAHPAPCRLRPRRPRPCRPRPCRPRPCRPRPRRPRPCRPRPCRPRPCRPRPRRPRPCRPRPCRPRPRRSRPRCKQTRPGNHPD